MKKGPKKVPNQTSSLFEKPSLISEAISQFPQIRDVVEVEFTHVFSEVKDILVRKLHEVLEAQLKSALERFSERMQQDERDIQTLRNELNLEWDRVRAEKLSQEQRLAFFTAEEERLSAITATIETKHRQMEQERKDLELQQTEAASDQRRLRAEEKQIERAYEEVRDERARILSWHHSLMQMEGIQKAVDTQSRTGVSESTERPVSANSGRRVPQPVRPIGSTPGGGIAGGSLLTSGVQQAEASKIEQQAVALMNVAYSGRQGHSSTSRSS